MPKATQIEQKDDYFVFTYEGACPICSRESMDSIYQAAKLARGVVVLALSGICSHVLNSGGEGNILYICEQSDIHNMFPSLKNLSQTERIEKFLSVLPPTFQQARDGYNRWRNVSNGWIFTDPPE